MQLLGYLVNRSLLLGQLFSSKFVDLPPTEISITTTFMTAEQTPPPSRKGEVALSKPDALRNLCKIPPATPESPPEEDARPAKQKRIARIKRVEPNSIYDIMHDHAGESLFIIPILWTDAQPQLLGVRFVQHDSIKKPVPDFNSLSSRCPPRPSKVASELSRDLSTILSHFGLGGQLNAMKRVMKTLFPGTMSRSKTLGTFDFHVGERRYRNAVRAHMIWQGPDYCGHSFDSVSTQLAGYDSPTASQSTISRPLLAFMSKMQLSVARRTLYNTARCPDGRVNEPVVNLYRLRTKRLTPVVFENDAYLVAVMIAMAQSQCYPPKYGRHRSSSSYSSSDSSISHAEPKFEDIPIKIICEDGDNAEFVVYNTVVTAAFLRRLHNPTKAPPVNAPLNGGLEVNTTRVQVWPVLGLKERLAKALGEEIAGVAAESLSPGHMETWGSGYGHDSTIKTMKRPREPMSLPDVFNASFSDEVDDALQETTSSPQMSPRTLKRRRLEAKNELQVF